MERLLSYLIEMNIALSVFFLLYFLVFRRDGNFSNRRNFLLFSMVASLIIPLFNFQFQNPANTIYTSIISLEGIVVTGSAESVTSESFSVQSLLFAIYLTISGLLLFKLLFNIARIFAAAKQAPRINIDGKVVSLSEKLHASSFFHLIFIDPSRIEAADRSIILTHEAYHVKLLHSLDRILSEIILALGWINPLTWILRRSIVVNHEYQADNKVIERGTDQISYQVSMLNQYIGSASISNQFSNQIKNRIKMLNKNYKKGSSWKSLLLIPVSMTLLLFMACNNEAADETMAIEGTKAAEEEIFYVVEEMPQWKEGGDMALEMRKFIAKNLMYPQKAKEAGAEGKVFIQFLVTKTGDVVIPDPSILPPPEPGKIMSEENEVVVVTYRPIDSEEKMPDDEIIQLFKDESRRVIELMPDLIPGKQGGKAVNVIFTMPITFKMQ